jgi:hypothetical protein
MSERDAKLLVQFKKRTKALESKLSTFKKKK